MITENFGAIAGGIGMLLLIGILFYGVSIVSADEKELKSKQ